MAESIESLMSSIEMDPETFKGDFASYRERMKKLHPVITEVLNHLNATADEYFGGKKELLVSPEDEEFMCSALELRRKPVAVVLGMLNCGKSTLLNEIFQRTNLVPTDSHGCTARLVYMNYAEDYESESWQLLDNEGNALGEPQCLITPIETNKERKKKEQRVDAEKRKVLPGNMINLQGESMAPNRNGEEVTESCRDDTQAVQQIIQANIHVDVLKDGIQLIDSPGFGENTALDNLFVTLIEKDLEPLIVYVVDGHQTWRETDNEVVTRIKGHYPQATVMFVVNKIDFSQKASKMDKGSDDEDDEPKVKTSAGKVQRLSELEPKVLNQIKEKGFLGKDESFHTSELFHCISAKKQAEARKKAKFDHDKNVYVFNKNNEFVAKFQRFEACFFKKMYERMKHLEGRVMNRVITLMDAFLTMFGKQQVGFVAAVNVVPQFIDKAIRAETHLKTQFSRYVDDIIKDEESIADTLKKTKDKVKDVGREKKTEFENLSLGSRSSLKDQRAMLSHLWRLFEVDQDNIEDAEITLRTKAAKFAVQIIDEVLRSIPTDMIAEFEKKMNLSRDRFYSFVKQLRETLEDDCLNNLFEQAYRIRNKSEQAPQELSSMREIMSLKPVIYAAQSALFDYVEEGMKKLTKEDLHLTELEQNMERWRDQFIESIFSRIQAESICGRLVRICSQKMDEMHLEFIRNISKMRNLCDEAGKLGDEKLKNLGRKVKPPLFLNLCEVYSVRYEMDHCRGIELGEEIGRDGCYTIHECPENDDLVVYVLRKDDCDAEEEWMKRAVDIFHAYDIMRQTDTICKGEQHPYKSSLVNCHGLWMPDRNTFHILFDKIDETVAEYVSREQPSLKQRLELALKVGKGLQLLHQIQYVHLDLRPRNIQMRGSQPKIHLCHWQSPLENIKLHTTVTMVTDSDPEEASNDAEVEEVPPVEVPPFHLHKSFQNRYERTDTTRDLDCYAFSTFIWTICEGSFAAYPENFEQFKDYSELKNALENDTEDPILPETPEGMMVNELDEHRRKLYELMKCLWTQPDRYTMEIANDRLAFLTGSNLHSGISNSYFQENGNGLSN